MKKPKRDFAQVAFDVYKQVIGEAPKAAPESPTKLRARKGGLKGGAARAKALTKEQRAEIARVAAAARWKKS